MDKQEDILRAIELLLYAKELMRVNERSNIELDVPWEGHVNTQKIYADLDLLINRLEHDDLTAIRDGYLQFLPEMKLMKHATQFDWLDQYIPLSEQYAALYVKNLKSF